MNDSCLYALVCLRLTSRTVGHMLLLLSFLPSFLMFTFYTLAATTQSYFLLFFSSFNMPYPNPSLINPPALPSFFILLTPTFYTIIDMLVRR